MFLSFYVLDDFLRFLKNNQVFGYFWSTLLWHRCFYPQRSRDALYPVCGIFQLWPLKKGASHIVWDLFWYALSSLRLWLCLVGVWFWVFQKFLFGIQPWVSKNLFKWPKAKNYFFLPSTFSLENWWEMQFSTTPLRSFSVLNLAWQIAPTLYYYETEFQIFWWCWTNLCWWLISSLFQIHKFFEVPWHTPNSPYDSSDRMVLDLSLYIVNVHVYLLEEWSKVTVRKTEIQADLRTQTTICW